MIHFPKVRAILVKELRESLRDRRTVFANIIVPVLLYPVMLLLLSSAAQMAREKRDRDIYRIAVEPPEDASFLTGLAQHTPPPDRKERAGPVSDAPATGEDRPPAAPHLSFEAMPDAEKALIDRRIQALVRLPPHFRELVKTHAVDRGPGNEVPEVEILYDKAEHRSQDAYYQVHALLINFRGELVRQRLKDQELPEDFLSPFRIREARNVASAEKVAGSFFGSILPWMFILMIITGAVYPAIDMTAGEKERSTLETLISAPVHPLEVIAGKFLAVAALALTNTFLNLLSFGLTFFSVGLERLPEFRVPWSALPATLVLLLPLTLFFAALLMAVASFAASFKEAQVYCLPIYLIPMLGLMIVIVPGTELTGTLLVTPVVNTALLIKELMLGHEGLARPYVFVWVSTCLYAAAAIALAARVFAREEVLFSAQGSFKLLLSRRFFRPQSSPSPADALLVSALLFPIYFYVSAVTGQALQAGADGTFRLPWLLILLPQALVILALPLAATWYLRVDLKETFLWRRPSARAWAAGLCLGGSSWILAGQFMHWQSLVWPFEVLPELKKLDDLLKALPPAAVLALVALTPAFCEEHLFRGFMLSGLRQGHGRAFAIMTSGVLFGLFHFSLYRQPITTLLGFALGYLAWESRSLWPGMLFHLLHNGLSVLCASDGEEPVSGVLPAPEVKYVLPAAAVFGIGLWLASGSGKKALQDKDSKDSKDH